MRAPCGYPRKLPKATLPRFKEMLVRSELPSCRFYIRLYIAAPLLLLADVMPHKHRRDKSKIDPSFYDLPPSKKAQSLPTRKAPNSNGKIYSKAPKRKYAPTQDDTPRAFTRLLTGYRPPRSGLDDGNRPSKKRKSSNPTSDAAPIAPPIALPVPKIQPHEPLSSFAARVDAALPFSGLTKKGGGGKKGGERQTKTEKKMQKMYKEWREEDKRRKETREAEDDEGLEGEGNEGLLAIKKNGKRKGGKRKRGRGESGDTADADDDEGDPWAHTKVKGSDDRGSGNGLVGLHDVVLAPPKLSKVPKYPGGSNIGKGVLGLKRQAELLEARKTVVADYRQMMSEARIASL